MRAIQGWMAALAALAAVQAMPAVAGTEVTLEKRPAGTFYTSAAIAGYGTLDMLVDTGSSLLVIDETMLAQLISSGNARYRRDLGGMMADGTQRKVPVYALSAMRVGEGCWVHDVEAAVFPAGSRAILGINVLTKLSPFTISMNPPRLSVSQCQAALDDETVSTVSVAAPPAIK